MNPLHLFMLTLAVVAGIAGPISAFIAAILILDKATTAFNWWLERQKCAAALELQRGPYTKAEFFRVPNVTMIGVRLYKGDAIAYKLSGDRP